MAKVGLEQLKEIYTAAEKLMLRHSEIVDRKIMLSSNIERISNTLFYLATAGGLIAIFSQFWIAIVSLSFALIACGLLIYKSRVNLNDQIDINLWLAERGRVLLKACSSIKEQFDLSPSNELMGLAVSEYVQELDSITADATAHQNDHFTASLVDFYAKKNQRQRYSAAIKNKYNRHGIQDLG